MSRTTFGNPQGEERSAGHLALPPERDGCAAPREIAEARERMAAGMAAGAFATRGPIEEVLLGGRRTLWLCCSGRPRAAVLALHGGGFRIGMPEFEARFAEALAERLPVTVAIPEYRLAPEAPFPAGLADALATLTALRAQAGDLPLIVSGDSAGAGLAAALGVLAAAGRAPPIAGLVLLSPWLDLTVSAPAYAENGPSDPLFSRASAQTAAELYLQGADPRHPLASPLFAPLAGYPPTFLSVGNGEVLRDDAFRFHAALLAAGGTAQLCAVDGMDHVAVVRGLDLPGAAQTFDAVCGFIAELIGSDADPAEQVIKVPSAPAHLR